MNTRLTTRFLLLAGLLILSSCHKNIANKEKPASVIQSDDTNLNFADLLNRAAKTGETIEVTTIIDLKGQSLNAADLTIRIKENGLLKNGTLAGKNATFSAPPIKCLENVKLTGSWENEKSYLEWFIGNDSNNDRENFAALCTLIDAGMSVDLLKIYPISLTSPLSFFSTDKDIIIRGKNRNESGLILLTKPANSYHSYFRSPQGNNIRLSNLTLKTLDYVNGIYDNLFPQYQLTGGYYSPALNPESKPNLDFAEIENCNVFGNIALAAYNSSAQNQSLSDFKNGNKVKSVKIKNCRTEYCNSLLSFGNITFSELLIENNTVNNFSSAFVSFSSSGLPAEYSEVVIQHTGKVICRNNVFENTRLLDMRKGGSMTPLTVKGGKGTLLFEKNKVLNLMSAGENGQSYPFYYTCIAPGKAEVYENTFKNVVCRGAPQQPACLVKQRGANNLILKNNTFEIEKSALVKIGVIDSEKQSLVHGNLNGFLIDFMQVGTASKLTRSYEITDNVFKTPLVNLSTQVMDVADFNFSNNKIEIEHFGVTKKKISVSRDGVFFLSRQRLDRSADSPPQSFVSLNNDITINSCEPKQLYYYYAANGVQNGIGSDTDKNYNYKNVRFSDKIRIDDTAVGFALLDAENETVTTALQGNKNSFLLQDFANVNHQRQNVKSLDTELHLTDYHNEKNSFPFALSAGSTQILSAENNKGNEINLFSYGNALLLYNLKDNLPLKTKIKIEYTLKSGVRSESKYELIYGDLSKSLYCKNTDGELLSFSSNREKGKKVKVKSLSGTAPFDLVVIRGEQMATPAKILFENTQSVRDFKITFSCERLNKQKNAEAYKNVIRADYGNK